MSPLVQDLIVAGVALGAGAFVVRRIIEAVRPEPADAGCEHCGLQGDGARSVDDSRTSDEEVVREFSTDRAPSPETLP
jgi:hypothetical protein